MLNKKLIPIVVFAMLVGMVLAPSAQADMGTPSLTDGPADAAGQNLQASPRLIVELASPPLAAIYTTAVQAAAVDGKLDANAPAAQDYIDQLQAEQAAFVSAMQVTMPSATVSAFLDEAGASRQATYQVLFNGLSVNPGMDRSVARRQLAKLPGVKAVYLDLPYSTQLYTSTALINAPAIWNNTAVGGRVNGGAGIKIASMDGGVHHSAPMMDGTGYTYPPGYGPVGLGLTENNNGKIIVSRAYFRPWDPPAAGDENPWPGENGTSHGMHTASTAAGGIVTATVDGLDIGTISGVAPRAYVMSYRLFYASVNHNESFYTTEALAALEDIVRDGADVLNNSWGEGPISEGGAFDAVDQALINAARAGIFVSMSNGNEGPGLGTGDHSSPDYINVAASSTSGTLAAGRAGVKDEPTLQDFSFTLAGFGPSLPFGEVIEHPYVPSDAIDPANILGCDPWPANAFAGKAALILRGDCEFGVKVLNAENAGAMFVVVYNHEAGGDELINMGAGEVGDQVTIPSIFLGNTGGEALVDFYETHDAATSILLINTVAFQEGNEPDRIADFSSRGPGVGNVLKPDIAAPGVNIVAQGYTDGATGEAVHLGYGQVSGTSMAAPHVAGAAALVKQLHPTWSPAYIKSALMSTAKYLDVYNFDDSPAQPLDMGAGRLDLTHAADPGVILNPPTLSFGVVPTGTLKTINVRVTSVAAEAETYELGTLYTGDGFTQTKALPGFSLSPATITLNAGESKTISVTFSAATSAGFGDNQGYIILDGPVHDAHMPGWARVIAGVPLADVLIIDNDFSDLVAPYDYLWYYTNTLETLGYSYAVWNTDDYAGNPVTIPSAASLSDYRAILLFTGDNYEPDGTYSIPTGLTQLDQDRLTEYLNSGGSIIAMGQDLSGALGADTPDAPVGSRNFLYVYRFGANWIQDSVSGTDAEVLRTPDQYIVPTDAAPAVLANLVVDLTKPRKFTAAGELLGIHETPPVTTTATGSFELRYDVAQNQLEFVVTVVPTPTTPITVTGAHLHAGDVGVPGPIVRTLDLEEQLPALVTDTLTLSGIVSPSLTAAEIDQLLADQLYVNVHTTAHPDGELRGQVETVAEANQPYVDELDNLFHDGSQDPGHGDGGTAESNLASTLILRYGGPHNLYGGGVAAAHRDQPSLERAGTDYSGRSVYASFGLEGMSEEFNASAGITPTTRAELLGAFLDWAWSNPGTAVISDTTAPNASRLTTFQATYVENSVVASARQAATAATPVSYRWDFGDGTAYTASASAEAGHTYSACGIYIARVEITDSNGNVSIGSKPIRVTDNCETRLRINLPVIGR